MLLFVFLIFYLIFTPLINYGSLGKRRLNRLYEEAKCNGRYLKWTMILITNYREVKITTSYIPHYM